MYSLYVRADPAGAEAHAQGTELLTQSVWWCCDRRLDQRAGDGELTAAATPRRSAADLASREVDDRTGEFVADPQQHQGRRQFRPRM